MPLNYVNLQKRLDECDTKLAELFKGEPVTEVVLEHIEVVKDYYRLSYTKAQKDKTIEAIVKSYEDYVLHLQNVKTAGKLDKGDELSFDALKGEYKKAKYGIVYASDSRYLDVIKHDLLKVCELMFWASTALALYASIYLIALPMLLVQPVLGIAMAVTIGGFLLKAAADFITCLTEFRGFGRHAAEYKAEVNLLGFFAPKETEPKPESESALYEPTTAMVGV